MATSKSSKKASTPTSAKGADDKPPAAPPARRPATSAELQWNFPKLSPFAFVIPVALILFANLFYFHQNRQLLLAPEPFSTSSSIWDTVQGLLSWKARWTDYNRAVYAHSAWVHGHADFEDGRSTGCRKVFALPDSDSVSFVNVMLGNGGPEPDLSGGMIPAVGPPFAMTRWTPQTRQHYVSMCPYNQTDKLHHGFLGTHQPAVWMGESGPSQISAGIGQVKSTLFEDRGLPFDRSKEYASPNYYRVELQAGEQGEIRAEMSATSRVGHIRYSFPPETVPNVVIQASRPSVLMSGDNTATRSTHNVSYPEGWVKVDEERSEIYGWNNERQDHILLSDELPAKNFKGYFVARFSKPFDSTGISHRGKLQPGVVEGEGKVLAAYATFSSGTTQVEVRVGVSFISIEQARRNIDLEVPDSQLLESTSFRVRHAWGQKLDSLKVEGATSHNKTVLYTSFAHSLVYPYIISENTGTKSSPSWEYYSGYLDRVVKGASYSGYSIWDTFRAQSAWTLLTVPERVGGMITSMLQDYKEGGWLPMWKNLVETNIMVGTHADSIIAQAMQAALSPNRAELRSGVKDFDWDLAWKAVRKNAYSPPDKDTELKFADREEHTPQEVRAGLTEYMKLGFVADDLHSESGSRTLDYAYDDHAASIVAAHLGAHADAESLRERAKNYQHIWNGKTGFMEARNYDGSWAGETAGWTEGDHWAYSLTVMHDVPGLIELMGGRKAFVEFMNRHFDGNHNLHTNEPSHHIPYLYSLAGAPEKSQEWIREIGENEYNHTAGGLSGNEDCGQMSTWYLFSALGFYPVDPASGVYVLGAPFFDLISLKMPGSGKTLKVLAKGASEGKRYVSGVTWKGRKLDRLTLSHAEIASGGTLEFEMSDTQSDWGR